MLTVYFPRTSVFTWPLPERKSSPVLECRLGSINARMVAATSSAVKGVPSEKEIPSRNWNVMRLPPSPIFHDFASSGS